MLIGRIKERYIQERMISLDTKSAHQLSKLIDGFLPITGSSLNAHSIQTVLNDVLINKRKHVMEFGAGISTLYLAAMSSELNLDLKITSVDDNDDWLEIIFSSLSSRGLDQLVELIYAPKIDIEKSINNLKWYDTAVISSCLEMKPPVDIVIVDGPAAHNKHLQMSRFPAFEYMIPYLDTAFSFYLDDIHRHGEKGILKLWEEKYELSFQQVNPVFSVASKGEIFNCIP